MVYFSNAYFIIFSYITMNYNVNKSFIYNDLRISDYSYSIEI